MLREGSGSHKVRQLLVNSITLSGNISITRGDYTENSLDLDRFPEGTYKKINRSPNPRYLIHEGQGARMGGFWAGGS